MSRRRYLSTDISIDGDVNQLSDLAAIIYTWAMPHFADDCRLTPKNAAEVKMAIIPGRQAAIKEVEKAMDEIFSAGLWGRDENARIFIDAESFYKYQTYIPAEKRRETPKNTVSPSPSPSPSPNPSPSLSPRRKAAPLALVLPDWIDPKIWEEFRAMRKKKRAAMTAYAEGLVIAELQKLHAAGGDVAAILEQSIRNNWTDVYCLKDNSSNGNRQPTGADKLRAETNRALKAGL